MVVYTTCMQLKSAWLLSGYLVSQIISSHSGWKKECLIKYSPVLMNYWHLRSLRMMNSIILCIIYSSGSLNWEEQRGLMFGGALVCAVEYQWIPHTKPVSLLSPEHTISQSHWHFCRRLCGNEKLDMEEWIASTMRGTSCAFICVIEVFLTFSFVLRKCKCNRIDLWVIYWFNRSVPKCS